MRLLMEIRMPNEPFNSYVREGVAGKKLERAVEHLAPEAIYFTAREGRRAAIAIVDVPDPSHVPRLCEPFFLTFDAEIRFSIVMTHDELREAGMDALGKRWSG